MTLNQQLHHSKTHQPGYDPNCPVCAAPAKIQAGQTIDPELARQTFEGLVRAAMVDNRVVLGNVEFWIDPDGPWKGQLSFSIQSNRWDVPAIQRDLINSMYVADGEVSK